MRRPRTPLERVPAPVSVRHSCPCATRVPVPPVSMSPLGGDPVQNLPLPGMLRGRSLPNLGSKQVKGAFMFLSHCVYIYLYFFFLWGHAKLQLLIRFSKFVPCLRWQRATCRGDSRGTVTQQPAATPLRPGGTRRGTWGHAGSAGCCVGQVRASAPAPLGAHPAVSACPQIAMSWGCCCGRCHVWRAQHHGHSSGDARRIPRAGKHPWASYFTAIPQKIIKRR